MADTEAARLARRQARKAERARACAESEAVGTQDEAAVAHKEQRKVRKAEHAQAHAAAETLDSIDVSPDETRAASSDDAVQEPNAQEEATMTHKERRKARKAEREQARSEQASRKRSMDATAADGAEAHASAPLEHEEEPLSHKERRKRRKMEKSEARAALEAPAASDVRPARVRPQRSAYSVWIGNLSFSTTQEQLTDWLAERNIQGISRVHMPQGPRKYEFNKGFAYVDLPSSEQVEACLALSEESLAGRRLLIKSGSDYTGRPGLDPTALAHGTSSSAGRTGLSKTAQKVLHAQRNPPGPTLFMGNLSFETTEDAIRELLDGSAQRRYLQAHGKEDAEEGEEPPGAGIKKIRMGTFEDTGKCKGFAFVDFETVTHATQALIEPRNGRLLGRALQLEFAGVDAVRRGASRDLLPDYVPTTRRRRRAGDDARGDANGVGGDAAGTPSTHPAPAEDGPAAWPERDRAALPKQQQAAPARRSQGKARAGVRLRPGAANAQAPRQQYAIRPSEGKRTTFD